MKKEYVFWMSTGCVVALLLWFVFQFQHSQETHLMKTRGEFASLQQEALLLKDHLDFIRTHEKELNFLTQKGWFTAHNRLIAGDFLDKLGHALKEFNFTFEPETTLTLEDKYHFKVTQITLEARARFDVPFYDFLENLLTTFPGVLRLQEFSLTRGEEGDMETSHQMVGKLAFEWVTMGDKPHED